MIIETRPHRVQVLPERAPTVVDLYDPAAVEPPLTARQIANRIFAGLTIGNLVAFAYDAHGAWAALTSIFVGVR